MVGYSLPKILHTHVRTVTPTTCFSSMEVTVQTPQWRSFGPAPAQMQAVSGKLLASDVEVTFPSPHSLSHPSYSSNILQKAGFRDLCYHFCFGNNARLKESRPRRDIVQVLLV